MFPNIGHAAVYHQRSPTGWSGPTGFYAGDIRKPLDPGEIKRWDPIYLWADLDGGYSASTMALALDPDVTAPPSLAYLYRVELTYVPPEIVGAPPLGTTWAVDPTKPTRIEVPTYWTEDGLSAYQFLFTIEPLPEPGALFLAGAAAVLVARRR